MKVQFYSDDEKKTINVNLFSEHADEWARKICESGLVTKWNKKTKKEEKKLEKNKISQIRKFYDEVLRFSELINSGEAFDAILPYIKMLNAKVAYAEGRNLVTNEFKSFVQQSLDYIEDNDPKSYDIFKSFFEAFMGYYKYYEAKYKA